jgi:plastocyanin
MLRKGVLMLAVAFVAGGLSTGARDAHAAPTEHVVTIEGMRFNPQTLTVKQGDRVVWTNRDIVPHTASATSKAFDSHSIAPNASWTSAPLRPGKYPYRCSFHPVMQGVVIVH